MALLLIALAPLLVAAWLLAGPILQERRRRRLRASEFPAAWREILRRRVPYFVRMPRDLQRQLEQHITVLVAEKAFIGCDGQEIDDEVRVTIAAQAALLILNRRKPDYYPSLRQILVYPGAFVIERVRPEPSGVLQEERQVLSGESWTNGQVILSWEDTLAGAANPDDGRNVVLHEFAHQLDQQKGHANGAPWLGARDRYARWSQVMGEEFARLRSAVAMGEPTLLSAYGATNPAEFFAVATEVFFEQPRAMAVLHPALYEEMRRLYRIEPALWGDA